MNQRQNLMMSEISAVRSPFFSRQMADDLLELELRCLVVVFVLRESDK